MPVVYYFPDKETPKRLGALKLGQAWFRPNAVNSLSESAITELQSNPGYQQRVVSGVIQAVEAEAEAEPPEEEPIPSSEAPSYADLADLSDYTIEGDADSVGAQDIVAETTSLVSLKRWLLAETRVTLRAIIEERIEDLASAPD